MQDVPRLNGTLRPNGRGANAVQSAWEPTDKSQRSDDEGLTRKPDPCAKPSHEIIDVDAEEEESRYGIAGKKRRKTGDSQVIEAETVFTTDEGSEDGEVVVVVESRKEDLEERERSERRNRGRVKIDRKRTFWASKGGTVVTADSGTSGMVA